MPSILSGCLILLKIAMAVNDGLHSMLSSIYNIIENVLNKDCDLEPVQETVFSPIIQCSKSRILEAFNKRRANVSTFEQTEVYVSNLNPYQEITITNKDFDGKRKRSPSIVKKSQSKGGVNHPNEVQSNVEISSPSHGNSQSSTPSLVSLDTGNESEYQSCKNRNISVELEENNAGFCVEKEPENANDVLESLNEEKTSIESDQSPNSSFLKVLQNQIQFTSQTLVRALTKVKNPSTENVYGLTDSESTDSKESAPAGVCSNSLPEVSASRKQFLEETAKLYEDFLQNYYHQKKDTNTNLKTTPNKGLKTESGISNGNEVTLEGNSSAMKNSSPTFHTATSPRQVNEYQQKPNHVPSITISDYSSNQTDLYCTGFGYTSSDTKTISKSLAAKHINTYQLPLLLQKDKWIEMDNIEHLIVKDSKKLYQTTKILKRNTSIPFEPTDTNQSLVSSNDSSSTSSEDGNDNSTDVPEECLSLIDSRGRPFALNELNYSDELDIVSLERLDLLKKVLQEVGATEVLEDPNVDERQPDYQKPMLDFLWKFSDVESLHPEKCIVEESSADNIKSALKQTNLINLDHIPFKALDTEEKQMTYLNDLTENCRKNLKNMCSNQKNFHVIENELFGGFEERHKIMLDTITNAYKNELDSLTRNAGLCLDELFSIDKVLKTKFSSHFKPEASSIDNRLGKCISPQTSTSEMEIDAFELPVFIHRKSIEEPLDHIENDEASDILFKNKVTGLLDTGNISGTTFTLDSTLNETSTPVKGEKTDDPIWRVSINLSSGSEKERCVNESKEPNSSICDSKLKINTNLSKNLELDSFDSRQELPPSPHVKEDISLEAEDWGNLAAQMSKDYEKVVSLLNIIDDGENSSAKKESNSENEDCNVKPDIVDTENIPEKVLNYENTLKEQLELNENSIDEVANLTGDSNSDDLNSSKNLKSNNNLITMNNADSTSVSEDVHEYEELHVKMGLYQPDLVVDGTYLRAQGYQFVDVGEDFEFVIKPYTNKKITKVFAEEEISLTQSKINDASRPVSDNGIINRDLWNLFTNARATVEGELEMKECIRKENFVNENFSFKIPEKQMGVNTYLETYIKATQSSMEETKLQLLKLATNSSHYEFLDMESKSTSSSKNEDYCSDIGKGTPISHMEDLIQREELETAQIYDDYQVCENVENDTHTNNLSEK